jgi:hypothetical protein
MQSAFEVQSTFLVMSRSATARISPYRARTTEFAPQLEAQLQARPGRTVSGKRRRLWAVSRFGGRCGTKAVSPTIPSEKVDADADLIWIQLSVMKYFRYFLFCHVVSPRLATQTLVQYDRWSCRYSNLEPPAYWSIPVYSSGISRFLYHFEYVLVLRIWHEVNVYLGTDTFSKGFYYLVRCYGLFQAVISFPVVDKERETRTRRHSV